MPAVGVWQAGERRIGWRSQPNFQVFSAGHSSLLCSGPTSISATSHSKKKKSSVEDGGSGATIFHPFPHCKVWHIDCLPSISPQEPLLRNL